MCRLSLDQAATAVNSELTAIMIATNAALRRVRVDDFESRELLLQVQKAGIEAAMAVYRLLEKEETNES